MKINPSLYFVCCLLFTSNLMAITYPLPAAKQRLIGQPTTHKVTRGEYFQQLAEQYDVGFLALMAANPGVDPFLTDQVEKINIPTQMLLPFGERKGIVINLPELRLYYFQPEKSLVHVFPVGVGTEELPTPKTLSYIGEKREDPIWRPTQDMKARYLAEKGIVLADEVPPGPSNPFGKYAMRLGTSQYLIHGTNQRFGIGTRASAGCIRMYDGDIKWLYDNVPLNTQVKIIDQPVKMSYERPGLKLFEVHQPLSSPTKEQQVEEGWRRLVNFVGEAVKDVHHKDFEQASGLVLKVQAPQSKVQSP
ncbi:L,D-transpeptidase family protein [Colwellia sp. MEBiC06753]